MSEASNLRPSEGQDPMSATLGRIAVAASVVSTLVYLSTSLGIHNFVGFLVEGVVRVLALSGWIR